MLIPLLLLLGRGVPAEPGQAELAPDVMAVEVGPSPAELRRRGSAGRPAAETLGSNIRGYYVRIPGGFGAAIRAAKESSAERPPALFPALCYEALDRPVPVVHGPADLPANGRVGGYFSPEKQAAYVAAGFPAARVQEVVEHELTHAWQLAPRGEADEPGQRQAVCRRYHQPLGESGRHLEILECMFSFSIEGRDQHCAFVRDYLCRPSEIDVRLAVFKRWWAWNHGELLARPEQVREALDHPRAGEREAWPDVNDAVRIWDSYRNQPEVREALVWRMLQVL